MKYLLLILSVFCHLSEAANCVPPNMPGYEQTSRDSKFLWARSDDVTISMFARVAVPGKPLKLARIINSQVGSVTMVYLNGDNFESFQSVVDQLVDDFSFDMSCVDAKGRDIFDFLGGWQKKSIYDDMVQYVTQRGGSIRLIELKQIAAQKAADQKRLEELTRLDESKFQSALNNKNPQAMYLSAGNYYREGEKLRANQIYENIITRFPQSLWAVKANDQLIEIKRASDATAQSKVEAQRRQDEAQRSDRNAKDQCYVRIEKCKNSCGSGSGRYSCLQYCESICSAY